MVLVLLRVLVCCDRRLPITLMEWLVGGQGGYGDASF